jgi:hypothetical protein
LEEEEELEKIGLSFVSLSALRDWNPTQGIFPSFFAMGPIAGAQSMLMMINDPPGAVCTAILRRFAGNILRKKAIVEESKTKDSRNEFLWPFERDTPIMTPIPINGKNAYTMLIYRDRDRMKKWGGSGQQSRHLEVCGCNTH